MAGVYVWCKQNNKGKRSTGHQLIILVPEKNKGWQYSNKPKEGGVCNKERQPWEQSFHG